jgi:DNA repair exonuclease SbcCD nuclease subunit
MKLVHAADLHLDSPMRGLTRYESAPVEIMRGATRRALENLVELCMNEDAKLLLLAGDLYDGDWKDYATGLFFSAQMSRLRRAGVRVALVYGNHDAQSAISRHVALPENVTVLPHDAPHTERYEDIGIAVHGQSYARPAMHDDLSQGYPAPVADMLNIGLLHTAATGREGHARYAPCHPEQLAAKGYDYWALGHVHQREVLNDAPLIVFPGNLQGRHARECGPKGATVISWSDGVLSAEARALDAARWARVVVDVSDADSGHTVVDLVRSELERQVLAAEGRPLAARVELTGACRVHGSLVSDGDKWDNRMRAAANDVGGVWLEKIRVKTAPIVDLAGLRERDDAVGQIAQALASVQRDDDRIEALIAELSSLAQKLPSELRELGEDGLRLDDPETVRGLLGDVEHLLLTRLLSRGRPS